MKNSPSSFITADFVESLQHDPKCTLLYGKNNVYVHTNDSNVRVPGYLSLHHNLNGQSVAKWTPNFLMNVEKKEENEEETKEEESDSPDDEDTSCELEFLRSALAIRVTDLKYIYCHQQPEGRGTIVIVSRQGLSWPPLNFHDRGHMLTFLYSLEKALLPTGQLDPPTSKYKRKWKSSSDSESITENVSPSSHDGDVENVKVKQESGQNQRDKDVRAENEATDFVFAVNFTNTSSDAEDEGDSLKKHPWPPNYTEEALSLRCKPSGTVAKSTDRSKEMMRRRIMSCVFYQWLAYCRHMKSLRSYAVDFIFDKREGKKEFDYSLGLTETRFNEFLKETIMRLMRQSCEALFLTLIHYPYFLGLPLWMSNIPFIFRQNFRNWTRSPASFVEFQRCIYCGGCEASTRPKAWSYLLNLTPWDGVDDFLEVEASLERRYLDGRRSFEQRSDEGCEASADEEDVGSTQVSILRGNGNVPPFQHPRSPNVSERIRVDVEAIRRSLDDEPEEFFTALATMLRVYFSKNCDVVYSPNHCDTMAVLFKALLNEALTFACFEEMVGRSKAKYKGNLDSNLVDLRSLIQLLDPTLFEFMQQNCDLSHLYFTQRWFLTEFTEEFSVSDAVKVREAIWASENVVSSQFPLFIALSLIQRYRDEIIQQNMGFVDVRNLFSEKAKTHDVLDVLAVARKLVEDLQNLRQRNRR